jgi:ubiquinone/menaquinone biosynthesis C-methylase UbiE
MGDENWRIWEQEKTYGETLYKRATGELPEMESSIKMAKELKKVIKSRESVLDVGCGAGHYLRSLKREIQDEFYYKGIDSTHYYIELARRAFNSDKKAEFAVSDIYNINLNDSSYDIVMCNNLLLHLPSIKRPLEELVRVAKKTVFVRFLCGERSFRIKDIDPQKEEYLENGEPVNFYYLNIYSRHYIEKILYSNTKVSKWTLEPDTDFDKQRIIDSQAQHKGAFNATEIIDNFQVNGYILLPWSVLKIEKK